MRRYLKELFCGQSPEDVAMYALVGCLVVLAVLALPLWAPFYVPGRVLVYLYDKEYE